MKASYLTTLSAILFATGINAQAASPTSDTASPVGSPTANSSVTAPSSIPTANSTFVVGPSGGSNSTFVVGPSGGSNSTFVVGPSGGSNSTFIAPTGASSPTASSCVIFITPSSLAQGTTSGVQTPSSVVKRNNGGASTISPVSSMTATVYPTLSGYITMYPSSWVGPVPTDICDGSANAAQNQQGGDKVSGAFALSSGGGAVALGALAGAAMLFL
ncbi:hypothetical protein B0H34DRAFT_517750 [Crassisporium funariophilum]|nr:hypothetical protein B0H34DRAFT_517750 [Crassisporium funariophilum]